MKITMFVSTCIYIFNPRNIMKSYLFCFKYYRYYESNRISTGLAVFQTEGYAHCTVERSLQ